MNRMKAALKNFATFCSSPAASANSIMLLFTEKDTFADKIETTGNLGDHFWLPFKHSAEYLGMHYITDLHTYQDKFEPEKIAEFKRRIEELRTTEAGA